MTTSILIFLGLILIIVVWLSSTSKYYKSVFNDGHYKEVIDWVRIVIKLNNVPEPNVSDKTAMITSAGLVLAYTRKSENQVDKIHFSVSQGSSATTSAVGGRFVFLFLAIFNQNKCNAQIFKTNSGVHHLELSMENLSKSEWLINEDEVILKAMCRFSSLDPKVFSRSFTRGGVRLI